MYEPVVSELDKLYAASKIVFIAWPGDPELQEERRRLESEIDGRGLRVFPEAVAEYESDIRMREALQQCTTSVHFFGDDPGAFDNRQWNAAVQLGKPCIIASRNPAEARRGPAGSPAQFTFSRATPRLQWPGQSKRSPGLEDATNGMLSNRSDARRCCLCSRRIPMRRSG